MNTVNEKKIKLARLARIIGISASELARISGLEKYPNETDNKRIVEGWTERENGKDVRYLKVSDIDKITVFYVYKNSKKIKNVVEFIDSFNKMCNEHGLNFILNECINDLNEIQILFNEATKIEDTDKKLDVIRKIVKLLDSKNCVVCVLNERKSNSLYFDDKFIKEEIVDVYRKYFDENRKECKEKINTERIARAITNSYSNYNSDKKYLESKLLKPYKEYFLYLEKKVKLEPIETFGFFYGYKETNTEIVNSFLEKTDAILNESLEKITKILKSIDLTTVYNTFDMITKKEHTLTGENRPLGYGENCSHLLLVIDDILDFYNSEEGKKINEFFKLHNLIIWVLRFCSYFSGKDLHFDLVEYPTSKISMKLKRGCVNYLAYDQFFTEHLLHDFYLVKNSNGKNEFVISDDKLIDAIQKILANGSFFVNSMFGDSLLIKAIKTNNPKYISVLKGYINNVSREELLYCCTDSINSEKMLLPTVDLIPNIDLKTYYKALYDGDWKMIDFLLENHKAHLFSDEYPIEIYIMMKGKNPSKCFEVVMEHMKKNKSENQYLNLKNNCLEIAAAWGCVPILKDNMDYLKNMDYSNPSLQKIFKGLVEKNLVEIFKELYSSGNYDDSLLFYDIVASEGFIEGTVNKETWDYMFGKEGVFVNVDVNRTFDNYRSSYSFPHENCIAGKVKEKMHFSKKNKVFLEKLVKESGIFKGEFERIYKLIEKSNNGGEIMCIRGPIEVNNACYKIDMKMFDI